MREAGAKRSPASPVEMRLLRDRLGLRGYRKRAARDPEKRALLLDLGLARIAKAETADYVSVGFRKRRVRFIG